MCPRGRVRRCTWTRCVLSVSPVSNCRRAIPGRLLQTKAEAGGCYRIGPFTESAQADKASAVLKEIPLAYERRTEEQTVVTGYRVYLPPLPTREAAEKKRRELSRFGFKDSSVMQEAGMENALSLGLFTVEVNAQKHMQALAAKKSTPGCRRSRRRVHSIGSISGRSKAWPAYCRGYGRPTGAPPRPRRKRHRASRHRRRLCPPVGEGCLTQAAFWRFASLGTVNGTSLYHGLCHPRLVPKSAVLRQRPHSSVGRAPDL